MSKRYALMIGNNEYDDDTLARLQTPAQNVEKLAQLLKDERVGGFHVETLINAERNKIERAIVELFRDKTKDDLLLLYFSGHGVLDAMGDLYLALKETEKDFLDVTAIPASFITRNMDRTYSSRVIVILDSCHSGAINRRSMGGSVGVSVPTEDVFKGNGYGRVILTATDKTSYAWEGDEIIGESDYSVFTNYLIEGVEQGLADPHSLGYITVNNLFAYVQEQIAKKFPKQRPQKFSYSEQDDLILARNTRLNSLNRALEIAARSRDAYESAAAIQMLAEIAALTMLNPERAKAAHRLLNELAQDADAQVAARAQQALDGITGDVTRTMLIPPVVLPQASLFLQPSTSTSVTQTQTLKIVPDDLDTSQPVIFINYASDNRDLALWVYQKLTDAGYQVWYDRHSIKGGTKWRQEIDKGLRQSNALVAILTPAATDPTRTWIIYEQEQAQELFIPIIPLLFEDCDLPEHLKAVHYLDFRENLDDAFEKLRLTLRSTLRRGGDRLFDETPVGIGSTRPFIGRRRELQTLYNIIAAEEAPASHQKRPIAIHGLAGSGKTMLLREIVRRMGRLFPGGVIYEQRGEEQRQVQAVLNRLAAQAMGSYPEKDMTPSEVRAILRRYGEILVAFDDVSDSDFDNIQEIIQALPLDVTILMTTQFRTEAEAKGYQVFSLGELSNEDALALLKNRFEDKGTLPEDRLLMQLVRLVQAHPLSLELAAGNCNHTSELEEYITDLSEDLQHGVGALRYQIVNVTADTSLSVSFEKSLRALESADKQLGTAWARCFRMLGIFPDNVNLSREIIGSTWGIARRDVSSTLKALTSRAFIIHEVSEDGNYRIHPLMRAFARALLTDQPKEYMQALQSYVGAMIVRLGSILRRAPSDWQETESEFDHIQHIGMLLTEAVSDEIGAVEIMGAPEAPMYLFGRDLERSALQVLDMMSSFTRVILPYIQARPELGENAAVWLKAGLSAARHLQNHKHALEFMFELVRWYRPRDGKVAEEYLEFALELLEVNPNPAMRARLIGEQGMILQDRHKNYDAAVKLHEEAVAIYRDLGDRLNEADALVNLGRNYWNQSRGTTALDYYKEALKLNPSPRIYNAIGSAYFVLAEYEKAIPYFQQGLDAARKEQSLRWEAENLNDMGAAYVYSGRYAESLAVVRQALEIFRNVGNRRLVSVAYGNISNCERNLGNIEDALQAAQDAIRVAKEHDFPKEMIWGLHMQALATALQAGGADRARKLYEQAMALLERFADARTAAGIYGNYGWLLHRVYEETDTAIALTLRAIDLMEKHNLPRTHGNITLEELYQRLATMRE